MIETSDFPEAPGVSARSADGPGAPAQRDRFQQVVEGAPNAMVMVDAAGRIQLFNAQAERMFGHLRADVVGRPIEMLIPHKFGADHPARRLAYLDDPAARPMGVGRELYALHKNGSEFPVEIGLNPIQTDEGIMVLSSIVDISHRKRLESRFRQVVEWAPSAMIMIDRTGRINMVNAQAERIFGYPRAELLGQPIEVLVPERLRDQHPGLRNDFFSCPSSRPMGAGRELYARRRDGTEFAVEIGLNPVETEDGIMVLSAIMDISDRKQRETRLEATLREKDILLSEVHHRVKNNLQIISSLLDMQAQRVDDASIRDVLRDSQNRIRSMTWIHQLLYESHNFAQVNIGEVLDSLLPALLASYNTHPGQIALRIDVDRILLPLNEAIPCGLIINELMANALKHAFPTGSRGEISVELKMEEAGSIALQIGDDGVGLPNPFDLDTPRSLGLQLVKTLSKQLEGELTVRPRDPTQFTLRFPARSVARAPGQQSAATHDLHKLAGAREYEGP